MHSCIGRISLWLLTCSSWLAHLNSLGHSVPLCGRVASQRTLSLQRCKERELAPDWPRSIPSRLKKSASPSCHACGGRAGVSFHQNIHPFVKHHIFQRPRVLSIWKITKKHVKALHRKVPRHVGFEAYRSTQLVRLLDLASICIGTDLT